MSDACFGHRCDRCDRCRAGDCCGADVGEAHLPREGEWPTPLHSPLGVLEDNGHAVRCTLCGTWHVLLGQHLRHAHPGVSADAYRAIAGLRASRSLLPEAERLRRSAAAKTLGLGKGMVPPAFTTEQRSILAYRREARAEVRAKRRSQPRDASGRMAPRPVNPVTIATARLRPAPVGDANV